MHFRFLIVTALVLCAPFARAQTADETPFTAKELIQGYREAYVLAKPNPQHQATIDSEESAEGTTPIKKFDRMGGLRAIPIQPGETPEAAIARLQATGRYEFVEVDHIKHAFDTIPNDPSFSSQWGLSNTGSNPSLSGTGLPGADIHAPAGWDIRHDATYTTSGGSQASVVVAVIDSGLRLTHSDISANLWVNPQVNKDGFVNDLNGINATVPASNAASGNPTDDNGHGTHVAGIVGAVGNNGIGLSGVAWKVQLMPLKFLDSSGNGSTANEITCINFAIAHGASVINASYGSSEFNASELAALQAARTAGIIVVAAAGNAVEDNDLSPNYPANYSLDNIVTVACSDERDDSTFFSNYGSGNVDLFAPGINILSLYNTSDTATATLSGTSMSAPFVTGAFALLKAQFPNDTSRQLINRLLRGVDINPNFAGKVQTAGRLNLAKSLSSADSRPFNDDFAARAHLAGTSFSVRSSNIGATRESGEPLIGGNSGGGSLWWEWTAPADGTVNVTTSGSAYATLLGIYSGTSLVTLSPVASGAAAGAGASSASFTARAGTTYQLTVDGQNGASGLTVLAVAYANDAFATPVTLSGQSAGLVGTNLNASRESGEPAILGQPGGHSVWYAWTPSKSGPYQISALSLDFDPLLAVYTGTSIGSLSLVSSARGGPIKPTANAPASVCTCTFNATAGTTYRIALDGAPDANTNTGAVDQNGQSIGAGQFTLAVADSRWQSATGDSITCAPAVAADGTIYVGSVDRTFYAFNPDGSTKWTYAAGGSFDTSAASVADDGTVYTGCDDGNLYAFNPSGALKWKYSMTNPAASPPVLAADGTIYIKDQGTTLYALKSDGTLKWTFSVAGASYASPTIASDGTIYIGSTSGRFYAISASGASKWNFSASGPIYTAAAIDSAGNVYFGTLTGNFYSVSPSGTKNWSFQAGNSISSSPALDSSGNVYFGSYDHKLYSLKTANGSVQWSATLGGEVRASSPAIDANGLVYVGCYDNNVYAINPDGSLNRIFATTHWVRSSPVIFGTTLYIGSNDHRLYAFDIGTGLAGSAWPMHLYDARRIGRAVTDSLAITVQPQPVSVATGAAFALSAGATGQGPLTFQWYHDGVKIAAATNSTYAVSSASASDSGSYTVVVGGPQGTVTSSSATVAVGAATPSRLVNLSVLSNIQGMLTVGFVMGGAGTTGNENILLRATGPALTNFGVTGILPDPTLTLIQQNSKAVLASNSGWGATTANRDQVNAADTATGAFQLANSASLDSALVTPLGAVTGGYSVQVAGKSGDSGNALTEIYEDNPNAAPSSPRLVNLSCLSQINGGTLTAGFVISGNAPKTVLIRGVGPTLGAFGVTGALARPQLNLYTSPASVLIRSNTGWSDNPGISSAAAQVGAFAFQSGSADAAILATLPAGAYTVQLSSINGSTGTALIEVYEVQ